MISFILDFCNVIFLFRLKDHNISRGSSMMSFASLYGMSDYVAFALGNSNKSLSLGSKYFFCL
jgi:hypothetical protein